MDKGQEVEAASVSPRLKEFQEARASGGNCMIVLGCGGKGSREMGRQGKGPERVMKWEEVPSTLGVGRGRGEEWGSHLALEHQRRLANMRMKTMNRNPTTAARPTSQGFSWRSVGRWGEWGLRNGKGGKWSVSPSVVSDSLTVACQAPLRLWDSPGRNTGVGCHALLQGVFPTQGSIPGLPALQVDSLPSEPPGKHQGKVGGPPKGQGKKSAGDAQTLACVI